MTRIEVSIEISAPVREVFIFASDWRRWKDWWVGLSGLRPISGMVLDNGTRYAYRAQVGGLKFDLETEIYDYEENVGWRGIVAGGIPHSTQWLFEPEDGKTRLTHIMDYDLPLPLFRTAVDRLLMRPTWHRRLKKSLGNLKRLVESQKGARSAP